ncbi:MAG: esterase family protein [Gemmatimonadaceae bacterium]|jgi:S-formylglutathione hydrolase FrmB|nr:esterase family protein [Gemmatimonadaceae bacterium]
MRARLLALAGALWCTATPVGAQQPLVGATSTAASPSAALPPSGVVRTDTVWSQSLGTTKRLVLYLPPSYARDTSARFPVLFYLHGVSGDEDNWVRHARLHLVMDSLVATGAPEAIIAMPDGDDSWYTTWAALPDLPGCRRDTARRESADQYCVPWPHYDDYIARDLVAHVDAHYRTRRAARHRAIAGLSMGGYGAVSLALRYPDVFSAAASHSGVLTPSLLGADRVPANVAPSDLRWARTPDELREAAGERRYTRWFAPAFGRDTIGWYAREPARLVTRLTAAGIRVPALFFDCGVDDPYLGHSRGFAAALRGLGVPYTFREHAGTHNWDYWRAQLPASLSWLLEQVRPVASDAPAGSARDERA